MELGEARVSTIEIEHANVTVSDTGRIIIDGVRVVIAWPTPDWSGLFVSIWEPSTRRHEVA